jgi:hypothetical protein
MLQEMITHRFPLERYEEAFASPGPTHIKTVIDL